MEPECSLLFLHENVTGTYPQPAKSSQQFIIQFINLHEFYME